MQDTETLLRTPKFDVERRFIRLADGRQVERQVIVHPGAVVVLPVLEDGRIVMINNHRFAVGRTLLELPAGTLEADEDPAACAGRELEEETGYRCRRIEPLCDFYTSPGILSERMYAFVASDLEHVGQRLEAGEEIEVAIEPADKIRQLLIGGKLKDGKTIAVLGTYFLQQNIR